MHSFRFLLCVLVTHFAGGDALSLFDALREHANASRFAQAIESDPALAALFLSPTTRTVFAPSDEALEKLSTNTNKSIVSRDTEQNADNRYQGCKATAKNIRLGTPPHVVLPQHPGQNPDSGNPPPGSPDDSRKAVSDSVEPPTTNITKRSSGNDRNTTKPVRISTGLGNTVNIIKGDIPYDGGIIHTVDGYFTVPQNFSATASKKNHTGFASLVNKANLTHTLDSTSEITIFIPTNEAIHSLPGNITANPSDLTTLLSNHVIKGFAGYLPYLVDGTSYTTSAGSKISISIKNGVYFVDGARIVVPNLITPNGVAHVINQVLTPSKGPPTPPPVTFTSASWSCNPTWHFSVIWATAVVFSFYFG